ncbi:pentapeptide repeat-containing protein [Paenibacillus macerans]|uniref:pentapeptide repeat-containing protein n=1 Tax=Paenibacillus macerans TaxID=44252 RepID=UPI00399D4710
MRFHGARFHGARFHGARFHGARFRGAGFCGAGVWRCRAPGAWERINGLVKVAQLQKCISFSRNLPIWGV